MTNAPECLSAPRHLILGSLGPYGLASAEVGIVGDAAHVGEGDSYHLGSPEQDPHGSYSIMESIRDRALTSYASALDVGTFVYGSHNLQTFSAWCVAQCKANAPDTRDIREIIYSPDGRTVKRWDRLGIRSSGDSSHTFHTHFSFFRDAIKSGRDQSPLFRRYLTTIGLLEDPDVITDDDAVKVARATLNLTIGRTTTTVGQVLAMVPALQVEVTALRAALDGIAAAGTGPVDTAAILAGVRDAVADLGEGGAAQVRGPQA